MIKYMLTPQQKEEYRSKYGITPINTGASGRVSELNDLWGPNEDYMPSEEDVMRGMDDGALNSEDESPEDAPKNSTPWASRAAGFVKGRVRNTLDTAQMLQKLGQVSLAALDPTKTYEQVKQETGIESLSDEKFQEIRKMAESSNKEENQGDWIGFIAELLWPTSKTTEVASGLNKSRKLIGEGLDKSKELIKEGGKKVLDETGDALVEGGKKIGKVKDKILGNMPKSTDEELLDIVSQKLTPGLEEQAAKEGRMIMDPKTKKVTLKPTKKDEQLTDAIRNLYETGELKPGALPFEHIPRLDQEVKRIDQGVEQMLFERKLPFNMNQLKAKLSAVKKDADIIFTTDPTLEKTYDKLIEAFMEHVRKGDTLGLFKARKEFDKIPAVKKLLDGLKGAQGENLRRQAVLDIRRAANDYVSDLLPENNPYKPLLKTETQLLEIMGNLAEKSKGYTGSTEFSRFIEANPTIRTILKQLVPFGMGGLAF